MNTDKTVWKEGMLLRPQHFQQNDRYYAHQLNMRTQLSSPYSWGFFSLEVDTSYLKQSKVLVRVATGIMPDGTFFEQTQDHQALTLDVPPNAYDLPVYLGLPLVSGSKVETREPDQTDALARYLSHDREVTDSNAGAHTTNMMSCARPDLQLLLGEQRRDSAFVKIKLCHIQGVDNNQFVILQSGFLPSHLHFHACKSLVECVEQVLNQLNSRGEAIADRMRSTGQIGGAELGDFMMLQLINRSELLLRHYLAMDQLHPEQVYRSLLTLVGDLSAFSSARRPDAVLAGYDHRDQLACFLKLRDAIGQVLSLVLEQHAVELPLEPHKYGVQVARLEDPSFLKNGYFVLVASAQCEMGELRQRLPQHLKIGTVNSIRDLVNLHLPGIKLSPLPVAPRQIPYHTNKSYFKLELSAQDISELENSRGFALHLSGEFTALELQFWAIRS
jgi:type VI secretion system protein ImpJ